MKNKNKSNFAKPYASTEKNWIPTPIGLPQLTNHDPSLGGYSGSKFVNNSNIGSVRFAPGYRQYRITLSDRSYTFIHNSWFQVAIRVSTRLGLCGGIPSSRFGVFFGKDTCFRRIFEPLRSNRWNQLQVGACMSAHIYIPEDVGGTLRKLKFCVDFNFAFRMLAL